MNFSNGIRCLLAILTLSTLYVYADETDGRTRFQVEIEESDQKILDDFINRKRKIPLIDKANDLKFSGEIHAEWNYYGEKINGKNVRVFVFDEQETINNDVFQPGDTLAIGPNDFDIQCDLFVDWDTPRTWARMHLRFDNAAGVDDNGKNKRIDPQGYHGSGTCNKICLKEGYVGFEIFKRDQRRLTIELGRRGNIYKAFYSELEFGSRLDGIILKYASRFKDFADWYVQCAGFVVDERATQCAWIAEAGLGNIMDTGLDLKYSFVDWTKRGRNRYFVKHPLGFRFKVSQVSFIYNTSPKILCGEPLRVFGGFLYNHTPSGKTYVNAARKPGEYKPKLVKIGRDQNKGGFFGMQYRELHKEGDWTCRGLIAYCEAQCIPDNDVHTIGTGNFLNDSLTSDGRGNTNWQGYGLQIGYALTNQWVFEMLYDHSWSIDNRIAGTHGFTRYCIESTYCF